MIVIDLVKKSDSHFSRDKDARKKLKKKSIFACLLKIFVHSKINNKSAFYVTT